MWMLTALLHVIKRRLAFFLLVFTSFHFFGCHTGIILPPWLIRSLYFVIFCASFPPHIPAQSLLSIKDTVFPSAFCKKALVFIVSALCKNVNMMRIHHCAQSIYGDKDKTRCRARSSECRSDKWRPCLTPVAPATHRDMGSLLPL